MCCRTRKRNIFLPMAYNFKPFKDKTTVVLDWVKKEFSSIRTGRATPVILDSVLVESYGSKVSIQQLASMSLEDARTLRITPYDPSSAKDIEKAIVQSNLGLSVAVDDKGLRIIFPELSAERRDSYIKVAKEKLEEGRRKIRTIRDDVWKDIQNQEREKKIREDDKFRLKDDMQKIVDEVSKAFDDLFTKKEKEIRS